MGHIILFFLIVTFIINIYMIFFSVTRKDSSRSVYFIVLTMAAAIYTAGYILMQTSNTSEGALNALIVSNLGIPVLAPAFLLISLVLFAPKHIKPWMLPAVGIYGILMFFCILFNDKHHLYYSTVEFIAEGHYFHIERGVLFWVQQGIVLLCMILAYIIMLGRFIKGNKKFRSQMLLIIIGAIVVFVANIFNFTGILPEELDPTPFALAVTLIFFTANAAKYKLLDIGVAAPGTALKTMEDAMIILDNDWCFLSCNDSAKSLFPSLSSFSETEPIANVGEWPSELKAADKVSEIVFELERANAYGSKSTYRANTNKIIDENGAQVGWDIVIHDITSITYLIDQLENLAATDPLTGISNRRGFHEKVRRELEMSARLNTSNALIMYDIDWFRKVNETYGHDGGDHALCAIVETIKKQLRLYDIMGRYGGEEFVIFMPASNEGSLYAIASRLCKAVEDAEIIYNGMRIRVTASFGAVQMPPGTDFSEAMLVVDEALYVAKHNGRNQAVVGVIKESENKEKTKNRENK